MAIILSKHLSNYDITSRLVVPKKWWILLKPLFRDGGGEAQLWVVDGGGMFWEFQCAVRRKGRHMRPVLQSGGWHKFVNYRGLRAGDRIVLESSAVHEFRGTRFVLRAQRLAIGDGGQRWFDLDLIKPMQH